MQCASVLAVVMMSLIGISLIGLAEASTSEVESIEAKASLNGTESSSELNATGSGSEVPFLEKLSDKGTYLVQLAWPQMPLNPDGAFDLQLFFLNATGPIGSNGTAGLAETNSTGSGTEVGSTVPGTMQNFALVQSYDITIYSDDGSVLWQRLDRPSAGSAPGERVILGNYTGPVTIEITDIRPSAETVAASDNMTDSVKFTASVVPEFPLVVVTLVAALAGVMALVRFRQGHFF